MIRGGRIGRESAAAAECPSQPACRRTHCTAQKGAPSMLTITDYSCAISRWWVVCDHHPSITDHSGKLPLTFLRQRGVRSDVGGVCGSLSSAISASLLPYRRLMVLRTPDFSPSLVQGHLALIPSHVQQAILIVSELDVSLGILVKEKLSAIEGRVVARLPT